MKNQYIKRINEVYRELEIVEYQKNNIGQNNDVIIINNNLVFRFPKYKSGVLMLVEETKLLQTIKDNVALPIPYPIYHSFDVMEVGQVFSGYQILPGAPLWKDAFEKIEDKDIMAEQLATFLKELHAIQIEEITDLVTVKKVDPINEMSDVFERIKTFIYPHIKDSYKIRISESFESFFNNYSAINCEPKLIHGDFGCSNIIYDSKIGRVTGIIDFGGSCIGDPAYDFAGILASYGEIFYKKCLYLYGENQEFSERVIFYKDIFGLLEALHGIEHDNPDAFENGIKNYR